MKITTKSSFDILDFTKSCAREEARPISVSVGKVLFKSLFNTSLTPLLAYTQENYNDN